MTASYNTGATGGANALSNTTACTLTLPSGVLTNDVMVATVMIFTYSGATAVVSAPTSGSGGANTWTPIGSPIMCTQGSFECISACFYRVATATDASSTFSVKYGGAVPSTNALYWAIEVESYTGFYTASPIGNYGSTNAINSTTLTVPSVSTARNGSWGIQLCDAAVSSAGTLSAPPATNRHLNNFGVGIDCAMSDTNGSAGAAGSSIGGGTFTAASGTAGGGMTWVIELCTQAIPAITPGGSPPQIPHPLWPDLLEVAQSRADWQAQGVASPVQQHWRLMDAANGRPGNGPGTATSNAGNFVPGTSFYVTQGGMWFEGYWWWVCASGSQPTTPQKFALWSAEVSGVGTSMVVPGSVVTSGTLTAGQWNWIPLPAPVQISIYGTYTAATGVNGNYPSTASQFGSGQPYSAGITSGPLKAFSDQGGSNPQSGGANNQGAFSTASPDPTLTQPVFGATSTNYWIDVQVTNVPPAGYQGSYRLWPNMADGDAGTSADASVNYVIGTEIILSQPCVVNAIWYYIPNGQGSSNNQWVTSADIWRVRDGVRVATQPNPVWLKPVTGGVDGNSNLGRWVYTQLPSTVTLQPGDYYVTIYNGNGSPNGWGSKTLGYWQASTQGRGAPDGSYVHTPAAPAGITSGPLYAPSTPAASDIQDYEQPATIEPGQSVFAVGPPNQFPNRYVGGSSGGGHGPALYQNYWVDLEVTPTSTYTPDAPTPPQIPHPLWLDLLEAASWQRISGPASAGAAAVTSYNTGTTADSAGAQVTSQQITIPAGVLAGDVVLVKADQVVLTGTAPTLSAASTGTTPVQAGSQVTGTEPLPAAVTGAVFYFVASATDAGKIITISSTASGFWALALAAYTGASNTSPIDVINGAFGGANSNTVTCPTLSTGVAGDWAVFLGGGAAEGGSFTVPAGSTSRQNDSSAAAIAAAISDSNGSAGAAGTSIGGGTFTCASTGNSILTAFTVGLAPAAPAGATATGVTATVALAAPAGTPSVAQAGVTATVALNAPTGVVTAGEVLTGVTATVAIAASAGSVSAGAVVTGATASAALTSPAGTPSVAQAGAVATVAIAAPTGALGVAQAGVTATVALAAPAGTVAAGAVVTGTVTTSALAAPAGSVTAGAKATGIAATAALAAPAGALAITQAGVVATVAIAAPAGSVAAGATATGVTTTVAIAAPAGAATGGKLAAGVTATVAIAAPAGSVTAGATAIGLAATITMAAPAGTPSIAQPGVTATVALAAPAGAVTEGSAATGVPATVTITAPPGIGHAGAVVIGVTTTLALNAPAGSVIAGATVTGIVTVVAIAAPPGKAAEGSTVNSGAFLLFFP